MSPDFDIVPAGAKVVSPATRLWLPSGRLVAAEPPGLFPAGEVARWAFAETVPAGTYPVEMLTRDDVVLGARVVVRPGPVREWRPAQCGAGQDRVYPVDGGTGSFGSVEVFEALTADEAREDLIADVSFDAHGPYSIYTDDETGTNLIVLHLGGDGRYLTWAGYTADGEVSCFFTDFGGLEQASGELENPF